MNKKILIDTDPGVDDALALILALKSNLDIRAVSVVAGNTNLNQAFANTKYILKVLNSNLKPIAGAKKPFKRKLETASVHGKSGLGNINIQPEQTTSDIDRIISKIRAEKINTIVTFGPLTNIAKIFKKDPKIINQIKEIVIMGGAVFAPGNITKQAEFNIYLDPEAANQVLKTSIKKTLIPLGMCNKVTLKEKFFLQIKNEKTRNLVINATKKYIKNCQEEGLDGAPMYDPLTIYYLITKSAFKTKKVRISISKDKGNRGQTKINKNGQEIEVGIEVDKEQFKKDYIDIING
jgi:purine nucleosidase